MTTDLDLYEDYGRHKGYTTPVLKPKHIRRLDAELWKPALCRSDMSFLEIGSGTGLVLYYLQYKGVENFQGIDSDPHLLDVIPTEVKSRFSVMDVWDFLEKRKPHHHFDRIILFDVLEHFVIEDCFRLLCKLNTLLRPEGGIVLKLGTYVRDCARMAAMVAPMVGKRLMYHDLTANNGLASGARSE